MNAPEKGSLALVGPVPWADSGYGVQIAMLARYLRDHGWKVSLILAGGVTDNQPWEGMDTYRLPKGPLGPVMRGHLDRIDPDAIIQVWDAWVVPPLSYEGRVVIPWIPVDCEPLSALDESWIDETRKVARDVHLVAMAGFGAGVLADRGYEPAATICQPVQDEYRPGDRKAWRSALGVADDEFLIITVGVNDIPKDSPARKGWDSMVLAVAGMKHLDKVRLHFHTEARAKNDIWAMARRAGISHRVSYADPYRRGADDIRAAEMASMYRSADAYLSGALGEGCGLPLREALRCGTPVVASRNSAITEAVKPDYGRLASGERVWCALHSSWWVRPHVSELTRGLEAVRASQGRMRGAAARAGERLPTAESSGALWDGLLTRLL